MKSTFVAICFLAAFSAGCASTETVKGAKGQGESRAYQYNYARVFNATLAAAKAKDLEVLESDSSSGRIILSHGVTLWSWGERTAVFLKAATDKTTEVEIVSKPVLAPLNFPPDWQKILLDKIDVQLRNTK